MAVVLLDSATIAAVDAAESGANGTREAGMVEALADAFAGNVTLAIYDDADTLLATVVRGAWTTDTASTNKSLTLGAYVSWTYAAAGTPARVVFQDGATEIFQCSAGLLGSGEDLEFWAAIASGVPVSGGDIVFYAQRGVDEIGWGVVPTITFTQGVASSHDISQYLLMSGTVTVSDTLPDGVTLDAEALTLDYDGVGAAGSSDNNVLTVSDELPVVSFGIQSATGGTTPFTFGHCFAEGDVPQYLQADIAGFQAVIKNRWPDGSVKFAILSGTTTTVAGTTKSIALSTSATPTSGTAIALSALQAAIGPGDVTLELDPYGTVDLDDLLSATSTGYGVAGLVRQWLSGPQCSEWHFYSPVGVDPHLAVWFFVRMYSGGQIEIETIVENGWCWVTSPTTKDYTTTLTINGTVRYSERIGADLNCTVNRVSDTQVSYPGANASAFAAGTEIEVVGDTRNIGTIASVSWANNVHTLTVTWDSGVTPTNPVRMRQLSGHRHHSRWSRVDWWGTDPQVIPQHDVAYMRATKLVPNYGWTTPPAATWTMNIGGWFDAPQSLPRPLLQTETPSPFLSCNFRTPAQGMGAPGYSETIGWTPIWEALYASSGDARAYRAMVGNARGQGLFMIHYRDETDGMRPFRAGLPANRYVGTTGANGMKDTAPGSPNLAGAATGHSAAYPGQQYARSHGPGAGYIAYLSTGRYYFLETLQFVSAIGLITQPSAYRPATGANRYYGEGEQRKDAWGIRHSVQAWVCTPDDDTTNRGHIGDTLAATFAARAAHIALPAWNNNLGVAFTMRDALTSAPGMIHTQNFMEHYTILTYGMAKHMKAFPSAQAEADLNAVLSFAYKMPVGLFGDGASAWNWRYASWSDVPVGEATISGSADLLPPSRWYLTWKEAFDVESARVSLPYLDPNASGATLTGYEPWIDDDTRALLFSLALANDHAAELGVDGAAEAWARYTSSGTYATYANGSEQYYAQYPTFMVVPR